MSYLLNLGLKEISVPSLYKPRENINKGLTMIRQRVPFYTCISLHEPDGFTQFASLGFGSDYSPHSRIELHCENKRHSSLLERK